jgi:hypothetical protein
LDGEAVEIKGWPTPWPSPDPTSPPSTSHSPLQVPPWLLYAIIKGMLSYGEGITIRSNTTPLKIKLKEEGALV